jgi:hypothetical protein
VTAGHKTTTLSQGSGVAEPAKTLPYSFVLTGLPFVGGPFFVYCLDEANMAVRNTMRFVMVLSVFTLNTEAVSQLNTQFFR